MMETTRDVLEHPNRRELATAIREGEGVSTPQAADRVDLSLSTVRYHLRRLEEAGVVCSREAGGTLYWFPAGQAQATLDKQAVLSIGRTRDVFEAIREAPGTGLRQLAERLDAYPSLVHPVVDRLVEAGLVERERHGRTVSLRPAARGARPRGADARRLSPRRHAGGQAG